MAAVPTGGVSEEAMVNARLAGTPLAGQGAAFVAASKKHNVDWKLLIAIAAAESELGRTGGAGALHNPFGLGPGRSYSSWGQAIDTAAATIESYRGRGLTTVPEIGSRWAPVGAGNDPRNLNSNWVRNVTAKLRGLGGDPSDVTRDPRPGLTGAIGTSEPNPDIIERTTGAVGDLLTGPAKAIVAWITDYAFKVVAFILLGVIGVWLVSQGASKAFGTPTVGQIAKSAPVPIPV